MLALRREERESCIFIALWKRAVASEPMLLTAESEARKVPMVRRPWCPSPTSMGERVMRTATKKVETVGTIMTDAIVYDATALPK